MQLLCGLMGTPGEAAANAADPTIARGMDLHSTFGTIIRPTPGPKI